LETGDLLITRSGINVGDAVVVPPELAGCIHGSYSIKIRLNHSKVSPHYVALVLNSEIGERQVAVARSRSAQPNINISELKRLIIPLHPRSIQDRIVHTMREAYVTRQSLLTKAETVVAKAEAQVEQMLLGEEANRES
jgi:restriction endonuclease S subunit